MTLRKIISVFILVFFSVSFAYAKTEIAASEEAEQQINVFSIAGYGEKGKKTWDLSAKSADVFTDTVKLKEIIGNLYGESENVKLTADKGDFDKVKANVHLEQNVVVTTSSGASLTTDSLDWNRKNQIVSTKNVVNIERGNLITVAQGATGEPNLNRMTLEKEVKVEIKPEPSAGKNEAAGKNKVTINCNGPVQIDYQKNIATFNKEVKVESDGIQLYSDVMDVYFLLDKKDTGKTDQSLAGMGSKLERIIAKGNVKIVKGENISYSDEAVYTAADKKITLLGRPKLVIYSTEELNAPSGN